MTQSSNIKKEADYKDSHKDSHKALNYEHNVYADGSYDSYVWKTEKNILAREITSLRKKHIRHLDFACGTGRILSFVETFTDESTGVDVSDEMLSIAGKKIEKSQLLHCDLSENDILKDRHYDLITAFRFFLNAQKDLRIAAMNLLSDKLINDGILIFNIHGNTTSYHILSVILGKAGLKKEKLNHLSYCKARKLIKDAKLQLVRMYGVGFIPSSFFRLFKRWDKTLTALDHFFSQIRIFKYFARNLIYVCVKK